MNKKILVSLSIISVAAASVVGVTIAYFNDAEISDGNIFTAGSLNLKVNDDCTYNGQPVQECTWQGTDLTNQLFFNYGDVKPGDQGENSISLHVYDNPAWVCAQISNLKNYENGCNNPETKAGDTTCDNPGEGQGELQDYLKLDVWRDANCNNIQDPGEQLIVDNQSLTATSTWAIADKNTGTGPITNACIGVKWNVPVATGNMIQGDSLTGDVYLNAVQSRNNADFICKYAIEPPAVLKEVTPVPSPTDDNTPEYTFNSTKDGTITYDGPCIGSTTQAVTGDNTITFNALGDGTYDNCYIRIQDATKNISEPLHVSPFVVDTSKLTTLTTKNETVSFPILQDVNIPLTGLIVSTLLSEVTIAEQQTTANVIVADADKGQILFVSDTGGNPFLISYIPASDIKNGTTNVTLDSVAAGFIMANPLMFGFDDADRLEILAHAENDPLYQDLKNEIDSDLKTEPYHLLEEAVFPKIYEDATNMIINAIKDLGGKALAQAVVNTALGANPNITVGDAGNPNLNNLGNDNVQIANPTMVFYGYNINNDATSHVIAGKDSLWQLHLGWLPKAQFTSPVTRTVIFDEGKDTINFSKFGLDGPGRMGGAANFLHAVCIVFDFYMWCPVKNDTITKFVEGGSILDTLAAAGGDFIGDSPKKILDDTIKEILKPAMWSEITKALYASASDKKAAISFLQGSKTVLESAEAVFKILKAYDAANVTIPFAWDLVTKPNTVQYCVTETNGVLSDTCQFAPPNAVISLTTPPDQITVGSPAVFDASSSTDPKYSTDSLMARWDFDGDGTYDTDWSINKSASWTYGTEGLYDATLQVKNSDGLVGQTEYTVIVSALSAGGTASHIKVFRDTQPWLTTSFETTMANDGYTAGTGTKQYEILSSNDLATNILTPGTDFVVIANDQDQTFYNNLAANLPRLDRFVQNGGSVLWEACDLGWNYGSMASAGITTLPGGVSFATNFDQTNNNVAPSSALMNGLPGTLTGTFASHEHFANLPKGATTYTTDSAGYPTLAEYHYGNGWIMITGQPLEYNVVYNPDSMGLVYPRLFNYVLGQIVNATTQGLTNTLKVKSQAIQNAPFSHKGN